MQWEVLIGLEIHTQLATQSKIFSGSATTFGSEPNTQASLVDLGMPGVLPVLNQEAVRMAVMFGLAIDAEIGQHNVFARKNYFYPDLPKGYQISQMELPIVGKGHLDIPLEDGTIKRVGVTRAHLEEDAGKSLHEEFPGATGIDLNRAGTPLLEIVSEPDMRSAKEAVAYVKTIHALVRYLGICDGNMAEGSLRCDCNVSIRPKGQAEYGTRCEIKNVNSFRFIEKAIKREVRRQIELIEDGGKVIRQTRLYDPNKDETRAMRSKEEANDYRYFPDPDLLPVVIEDSFLNDVRATLPELPQQKRERFQEQFGLSVYDASVLASSREQANYFEKVVSIAGDAKLAANWVMVELGSLLNKQGLEIDEAPVTAEQLGGMLLRIKDNTISGKIAKTVFEAMAAGEGSADEIIEKRGLKQVTDSGAISAVLDEMLAANAEQVEQYRAADEAKRGKMFGFFVGQAMKASKGIMGFFQGFTRRNMMINANVVNVNGGGSGGNGGFGDTGGGNGKKGRGPKGLKGKALGFLGSVKGAAGLMALFEAIDYATTDKPITTKNVAKSATNIGGAVAGGALGGFAAGALTGAAAGSVAPGVGTIIGGIVGGMLATSLADSVFGDDDTALSKTSTTPNAAEPKLYGVWDGIKAAGSWVGGAAMGAGSALFGRKAFL